MPVCSSAVCWGDYLCSIALSFLQCQRSVAYVSGVSFSLITCIECLLSTGHWISVEFHPCPNDDAKSSVYVTHLILKIKLKSSYSLGPPLYRQGHRDLETWLNGPSLPGETWISVLVLPFCSLVLELMIWPLRYTRSTHFKLAPRPWVDLNAFTTWPCACWLTTLPRLFLFPFLRFLYRMNISMTICNWASPYFFRAGKYLGPHGTIIMADSEVRWDALTILLPKVKYCYYFYLPIQKSTC